MNSIEKIKLAWEKHCEEYGYKSYIHNQAHLYGTIMLMIKEETAFINFYIDSDKKHRIDINTNNYKLYKLFTSFYEKLMKGEIDE